MGAGVVIGLLVPMLPSIGIAGAMLLDYAAHTHYAFVLAIAEVPVHALYSVVQQSTLSVFILGYSNGLLAVCVLAWAYLRLSRKAPSAGAARVAPQPASFPTSTVAEVKRHQSSSRHTGSRRREATIVASLVLIITLATYFGGVGVLLVTESGQPSPQSSTVYINGSPVSWQVSPSICVVIGVNNTVTWASRSVSSTP